MDGYIGPIAIAVFAAVLLTPLWLARVITMLADMRPRAADGKLRPWWPGIACAIAVVAAISFAASRLA